MMSVFSKDLTYITLKTEQDENHELELESFVLPLRHNNRVCCCEVYRENIGCDGENGHAMALSDYLTMDGSLDGMMAINGM